MSFSLSHVVMCYCMYKYLDRKWNIFVCSERANIHRLNRPASSSVGYDILALFELLLETLLSFHIRKLELLIDFHFVLS